MIYLKTIPCLLSSSGGSSSRLLEQSSSNRLNLNSRSRRNTSSPREPVIHFGWLHFIFVLIFEAELL